MKNTKKQGFTLIELIIVILILAILAVFATPRFIELKPNARKAVLGGLIAQIQEAVGLAQASYKLAGSTAAITADMDGTAVTVIAATGRPVAETGGLDTAIQFQNVGNTGLSTDLGSTTATDAVFSYSATRKITYDETTGLIAADISNCST